jgi:TPR repeat protein
MTMLAAGVVALAPVVAWSGPLEDGKAAFERGDYAAAEALLLPLAQQGDPTAQGLVGAVSVLGLLPDRDLDAGMARLRKAAGRDDALAEYLLGEASAEGIFGQPRDLPSAVAWFRKAAAHPDPEAAADAQLALGRLAASGLGGAGAGGAEEARRWYAKAFAGFQALDGRGLVRAKLALAAMYAHGEGTPRDAAKAAELYRAVAEQYERAAEQGSASMQAKLGVMYLKGQGVPKDALQGYAWLRRAADQGEPSAMMQLAGFYLRLNMPRGLGGVGLSDPENQVQSYVWLRLSVNREPPGPAQAAAAAVEAARELLSDPQKARAETMIAAWRPVRETPGAGGPVEATAAQAAELGRLKSELAPH